MGLQRVVHDWAHTQDVLLTFWLSYSENCNNILHNLLLVEIWQHDPYVRAASDFFLKEIYVEHILSKLLKLLKVTCLHFPCLHWLANKTYIAILSNTACLYSISNMYSGPFQFLKSPVLRKINEGLFSGNVLSIHSSEYLQFYSLIEPYYLLEICVLGWIALFWPLVDLFLLNCPFKWMWLKKKKNQSSSKHLGRFFF